MAMSGYDVPGADLDLPDPLTTNAGETVATPEAWTETRRPEILELFRTHVYGRAPVGRPEDLRFEVAKADPTAMDGAATRKLVNVRYSGPGGEGGLRLILFVPNAAPKPAPAFLLISNRDPDENLDPTRAKRSGFWPAEEIVARGYAAAAFHNADVDPDRHDGFKNGVHGLFDPPDGPRAPDAWGAIAAWAWGASRALDYLETDVDVDARRVAVVGHSRGGKTALWAGAEDPRFAMVVSNESGCTGAALARRKRGERVRQINDRFPHWFCAGYTRYNGREDDLPLDQHMLLALAAPRLLYVASASEDAWADPEGEFLAARAASPVYRLLGQAGLEADAMPGPGGVLHAGRIGYHLRPGKHNLTRWDWARFMDFADRHGREEG